MIISMQNKIQKKKKILVLVSVRQDQKREIIFNFILMATSICSLQKLLIWVPGIKSNLARDIIKLSGVSEWKNMYKVRAYAFSVLHYCTNFLYSFWTIP